MANITERGKAPEAAAPVDPGDSSLWKSLTGLYSRLGLAELAKRTWNAMEQDGCVGLAAQMSYYFVLSLFPFLIFLAALIGYLPFTGLWDEVLKWIAQSFPTESQRLVLDTVLGLTRQRTRFLSIGLFGALWAASSGIVTLIESLDRAYQVKETRGFWKIRATALAMVFVISLFFMISLGLIMGGHFLGRWISNSFHLGPGFYFLWQALRWILSLTLLGLGVALTYYVLPNVKQPWRWVTPGSIFFILTLMPASLIFGFYVRHIASYDKTYGSLGGFVILMVWIYISGLILLMGAEINSELEKTSPQTDISQDHK